MSLYSKVRFSEPLSNTRGVYTHRGHTLVKNQVYDRRFSRNVPLATLASQNQNHNKEKNSGSTRTTFLAEGLLTPKPLSPPGGLTNSAGRQMQKLSRQTQVRDKFNMQSLLFKILQS